MGDTINWGIFKRRFWGELLRHQQRFRDYPKLPKFFRHRSAIALMSPPSDQ
jgi:hypothetical protein